jgi:hypothetical protein
MLDYPGSSARWSYWRQSKEAFKGSKEAFKGSKEAFKGSKEAFKGSKEACIKEEHSSQSCRLFAEQRRKPPGPGNKKRRIGSLISHGARSVGSA